MVEFTFQPQLLAFSICAPLKIIVHLDGEEEFSFINLHLSMNVYLKIIMLPRTEEVFIAMIAIMTFISTTAYSKAIVATKMGEVYIVKTATIILQVSMTAFLKIIPAQTDTTIVMAELSILHEIHCFATARFQIINLLP